MTVKTELFESTLMNGTKNGIKQFIVTLETGRLFLEYGSSSGVALLTVVGSCDASVVIVAEDRASVAAHLRTMATALEEAVARA